VLRADGWRVELHDDHFEQDTVDEAIFPVLAERGWILVTQDKRIRRRPAERLALLRYGVRTFSIASTANPSAQATIQVLRAARPEIEKTLSVLPGPFVVAVYKDGSLAALDVGQGR
jgi:PIN like domain